MTFPNIYGCRCSMCGKWHNIVYKIKGRYVCVNCKRKIEGGGKVGKNSN